MRLPYSLSYYNLFYTYLRLRYVVLKILKTNMYFWANSRCRIKNSIEKAAVFLLPLSIIGLKIAPREYVTHITGEPKYKYGQQEQVTVRNHNISAALERSVLKYWGA